MISVRPSLLKPHRLNGPSEHLLFSHYENNYGGALRRLNAIHAVLRALDWSGEPVFEINGCKREELIAAGSVMLNEIYFDGLGGEGGDPPADLDLAAALERAFGSLAASAPGRRFVAERGGLPGSTAAMLVLQPEEDRAH